MAILRLNKRADWAFAYCARFGFRLVPLEGKRPILTAWNCDENLISSPEHARLHWKRYPHIGIGVCLGPSNVVSLDIDHHEAAVTALRAEGIDLAALMESVPTIRGNGFRLMWQAPAGEKLDTHRIVWPARLLGCDRDGHRGGDPTTVLEFRAGRVQDVLPPSIHPTLRRPYRWAVPPVDGFPALPAELLKLWLDWPAFESRAKALCSWAAPEPEPAPRPKSKPRDPHEPSVIEAFNQAHDAVAILEAHGYKRKGKRWRSPHAEHHEAGVTISADGKVFCWHHSDPLGGTASKPKPRDAFDLFRILDHGGDYRAAVRAAAEALGMRMRPA
jgi:putative DNA primase/helicase